MTEQLTGDDFNKLFRYFTTTAFRLEVQPAYDVTDERQSFDEFLAGEPRPATEFPFYAAWLDQIRSVTTQGRRVERVRVLSEPPTDYQRWEMWSGQYNTAAGERIRYMSRSRAENVGLPIEDDWWLFDSLRLALMRFSDRGEPLGGKIITDPTIVSQHVAWWNLAVRHSSPDADATRLAPESP
ncbi:DUF6879 family protein [Micromonospora marina]|uniref:DUF6879 family protein n=1 Tax=Micromonospora marina TaxID=307120 RepID=UPI003D7044D3